MGVGEPVVPTVAREEGGEGPECDRLAWRHPDGLDELAVAEEIGLLVLARPAVGEVDRSRALGEEGGLREVGDPTVGLDPSVRDVGDG